MRTLYIFTMASAILCTAFIVYLHTYTCFGQPANFFKQNNVGNKQGVPGAQSCPNTFFPNNLTRNGNGGNNGNSPTQEIIQKLPNLQPYMNLQKEQPFNLQQAKAVQQMNMKAMANLEQKSRNMQQQLPIPEPFNGPSPISLQPCQTPQEPLRNYNVPSPVPDMPIEQKLSYQLPIQSTMPIQYAVQNVPQSFSIPVSGMAPYSLTQNYGIPTTTGLIGSNSVPVTIVDNSRPYYNPYPNSQPSALSYFPSLNANQGIMIGQNDIVFKSQNPPLPAYISIVQAPVPSPQYRVAPSYPINTVVTPDPNQESRSSVKALLPILINMLKEKSTQCPCKSERNCERKKKRTSKPQITSGYSKQKKYPLSEDGPAIEISQEVETTRNVREPKKAGKLKNIVPESTEAQGDESSEYSEEEESEDK